MRNWTVVLLLSFSVLCDAHAGNLYEKITETPLLGTRLLVNQVFQRHELSCEAAALAAALQYLGVDISEEAILIQMPFDRTLKQNGVWGDPNKGFVGDIDGITNVTGYGIHWKPLAELSRKWMTTSYVEYGNLNIITRQIKNGKPVLVWISSEKDADVLYWKNKFGEKIKGLTSEHVVVVYGFEGEQHYPLGFYIMDPIKGFLYLDANEFQLNWEKLDRSAVVFE